MASEFVQTIQAFLDLQAHGNNYVGYALDVAYDFLADDTSPKSFAEEMEAIEEGEQRTYIALKNKAFPDAHIEDFSSLSNDWLKKLAPNGRDQGDSDLFVERLIDSFMSKPSEGGHSQGELLAAKMGMSLDDYRAYAVRGMKESLREAEISELKSPSLHRFLLRKFLSRLDLMVAEIEQLDQLGLDWTFVPPHLQTILSNAHDAALSGNTVAASVLCGAALEEALKNILGRDRCKNLSAGIAKAVELGLLQNPSPAYLAARQVQARRNEAVHDPEMFLRKSVGTREVLDAARFSIVHLFEAKG